jgi:hypothetical protein
MVKMQMRNYHSPYLADIVFFNIADRGLRIEAIDNYGFMGFRDGYDNRIALAYIDKSDPDSGPRFYWI